MRQNLYLLLLIGFSVSAQIKGVVKDSVTGKSISYVNIWVQNENIGSTSEENGSFSINTSKDKNLIFSALGFENKIIKASESSVVTLNPKIYNLDEVVIVKRYKTKEIEIGKIKNSIYQAFDNGPRIDVKYFPYLPKYSKTKFIKQVTIETDSKIEKAAIKIHFFGVNSDGFPGDELLSKDFIVTVKEGVLKNIFDVTELNLRMPKTGLFVGFEKLMIEKNKTETTVVNSNNNTTSIKKVYYPLVLYNFVERDLLFSFSGGKWNKQIKLDNNKLPIKMMINEPAINLILTN
jgi:hypothetical protein